MKQQGIGFSNSYNLTAAELALRRAAASLKKTITPYKAGAVSSKRAGYNVKRTVAIFFAR